MRLLALEVLGLFVLRGAATYGSMVTLSRIGNRIVATAQRRVFDRLLKQNIIFFQDRHSSEFIARLALAANGVRDALQLVVQGLARDALTVVGLVVVMIFRDPVIAVGALCALPIADAADRPHHPRGAQVRQALLPRLDPDHADDGRDRARRAHRQVLQPRRRDARAHGRRRSAASRRSANRIAAGGGLATLLADSLAGVAIAFAIFYGSWRVSVLHADVGSFVSFLGALLLAYEPAKRLSRFPVDIQNGLVGARDDLRSARLAAGRRAASPALPTLEVSAGPRRASRRRASPIGPAKTCSTASTSSPSPTQTTALVGPSGGGKSTILGLIQRFYALRATAARRSTARTSPRVDLASLRDKIAFVSQDVFLFRGSIRDNIALGRPGATRGGDRRGGARRPMRTISSCNFADGYDTNVGEQGAQLSGGQRQRIAIARAILKDAPILLLDEPTAALDSESEREVQKALDGLRVGRTTIVVAHRLQTIVGADRIFVIEKGRAVEFGLASRTDRERRRLLRLFRRPVRRSDARNAELIGRRCD